MCGKSYKKILFLQCFILTASVEFNAFQNKTLPSNVTTTTTTRTATKPTAKPALSARNLGRSLAHCFGADQKLQCIQTQLIDTLETAIVDNHTWHYSDYLMFEKNANVSKSLSDDMRHRGRSLSDLIGLKLLQLARSRSIRLRIPDMFGDDDDDDDGTERGISNAIDDVNGSNGLAQIEEGRKKKDKDKHMAMMGGMAMMAMVAQMFLGKVILIAGSAFIMAKIALVISLLGSLKKGSSGSSSNTDHIIVTGGSGGGHGSSHVHESSSGWHRSMPQYEIVPPNEHDHYLESPIVADSDDTSLPTPSLTSPPSENTLMPQYYDNDDFSQIRRRRKQPRGFLF